MTDTTTTNPPPAPEQLDPKVVAAISWALTMLSGIAVSKGWLSGAQANNLVNALVLAIGPLGAVVILIWQIWRNNHAKILNRVANLPGVTKIEADPGLATDANHPKVVSNDPIP